MRVQKLLSAALSALAVVPVVAPAAAADPPGLVIRLPDLPIPDVPKPPPDSVVTLSEGQLYIIDSDVQLVVLSSPAGILTATEEKGPVKMRGEFVDKPGKVSTRTFKGPWVYTVDVVATGRAELLVVPLGFKTEKDVLRRTLDANLGPRPPPVPPVPPVPPPTPGPIPPPAPVKSGEWVIVVADDANQTVAQGQLLDGPTLRALKAAGKCRVFGSVTEADKLKAKNYDKTMSDFKLSPPCFFVLDGSAPPKVVASGPLPADDATLAAKLKEVLK